MKCLSFSAKQTPFQISFLSDNWEVYTLTMGEAFKAAGFRLAYKQTTC
jgi:hypothetical protein